MLAAITAAPSAGRVGPWLSVHTNGVKPACAERAWQVGGPPVGAAPAQRTDPCGGYSDTA